MLVLFLVAILIIQNIIMNYAVSVWRRKKIYWKCGFFSETKLWKIIFSKGREGDGWEGITDDWKNCIIRILFCLFLTISY